MFPQVSLYCLLQFEMVSGGKPEPTTRRPQWYCFPKIERVFVCTTYCMVPNLDWGFNYIYLFF